MVELRRLVANRLVARASGHLSDGERRYSRWKHDNSTLRALLGEGVEQPLLFCADEERLRPARGRRRAALERAWGESGPCELRVDRPLGSPTHGPAPEDRARADDLLSRTLEHQGGTVVWPRPGEGLALVRVDDLLASPFLPSTAPALQLPQRAGFRPRVLDGRSPLNWPGHTGAGVPERLVLLQLFVRGNPCRGSVSDAEPWARWLEKLLSQQRLAGLVVYGSPDLWQSLRRCLPVDLPAAWSPGRMPHAQALVLARLGLAPEPPTAAEGLPAVTRRGFTE